MRIGFDAKRAFANKTGLGNYSRFILNALMVHEPGHEYLAYTPKNSRHLFDEYPAGSIRYPEGFIDQKLSAYWRYARITRQLTADKTDVYHGLSNEIPQGLQQAGIRSVVTIHDLIFERLPHLFKPIDRAIYRHKFQSACRRADAVVAVSDQTRRDLIELYGVDDSKIEVIYQDCNPVFQTQLASAERDRICAEYGISGPFILCVGTLEERKNQHRLVEAFAQLKNHDFKLVLVGKSTGYVQKIKETIQRLKLEGRVMLLHDVSTPHLPALYQAAEVFAYISVYEGFGIPIVEALHSGTAVLAAKGSCLEEAGGPGGLYADPYQTENISEQLQKLVTDVHLRNSLSAAGRAHVQQFSGKHIAGQLVQLYKSIS
ncbi:glycosyltransferase family 4 protein [Dyadobacter fermentans]|uniref:Glycosyl transferase group 1 n=1 Tax=Dyadobacter fermentans (strain ATCC 700827 / DSM 18053 / CIP 107007 / KCTC 52180 / NS114) TaxID=471854 RepID=C6W5F0_DYAFD|nr:glycosyltransferase family 1 protein [Dyadobacter fermentans]ACT94168.1 glycosyl transferase group 1 [Dyadobacter fermentans DSM 18053]